MDLFARGERERFYSAAVRLADVKTGWRIIDLVEGDAALLVANLVFENDLIWADEVAEAAPFRMRKNEPLVLNDLVSPVFAPNVVAAILVQNERRALAFPGLVTDLDSNAAVFAIEGLGMRRRRRQTAQCEYGSEGKKAGPGSRSSENPHARSPDTE